MMSGFNPNSLITANDCELIRPHRKLERDFRRLDIELSTSILGLNNRKLNQTESISLPTTPTKSVI
mgnify:CR=1 FL=1